MNRRFSDFLEILIKGGASGRSNKLSSIVVFLVGGGGDSAFPFLGVQGKGNFK